MTHAWDKKQKNPLESISEKDAQYLLYGDIGLNILSDIIEKPRKEKHKKNRVDIEIEAISKEVEKTKRKISHYKQLNFLNIKYILISFTVIVFVFLIFTVGIKVIKNMPLSKSRVVDMQSYPMQQYAVQAATYKNKKDAEYFIKTLNAKGYPAFISSFYSKKGSEMYKVCVGPLKDRKETENLLVKLRKEKGAVDSFVITIPSATINK